MKSWRKSTAGCKRPLLEPLTANPELGSWAFRLSEASIRLSLEFADEVVMAIPVSTIPVSTIPVSTIPVSTIPVSNGKWRFHGSHI